MFTTKYHCPVCADNETKVEATANGNADVVCKYCGEFSITPSALAVLELTPLKQDQLANARGWMRENQNVLLYSEDLEALRNLQSPTIAERANKLLAAFNKETDFIGEYVEVSHVEEKSAKWVAYSWSKNVAEMRYLFLTYMVSTKGWMINSAHGTSLLLHIAPQGYDHLEGMRLRGADRVSGFCAMWFSPEVKPLWTGAIKPAINAAGYNAIRIDGVEHNNKIDDEILANIRASRFVVADFTGERGGVYFEAGFALGLGIPVIWTVRADQLEKIHFDNRQYNFLKWEPDDLSDFARRLQLRIEATIGRGPLVVTG